MRYDEANPRLSDATDDARDFAYAVLHWIEAGHSVADIALTCGVQHSVVEWWLAVARLPNPRSASAAWQFAECYG